MKTNIKKLFAEAMKDQKAIFGDDLYDSVEVKIEQLESFDNATSLEELNNLICNCQKCELGKTRTKFVFGVGNPNADAMLIGEAPGADEDKQGEPFVGRAGKLLNDILIAIKFKREDVFIANTLKCRPPNNRDPHPLEMETCRPYLDKQIELIKPKVILCLGRIAASQIIGGKLALAKMRGEVFDLNGIKVMATYHPAALLRNPGWKKGCWEDVQKFRKLYDELTGK
ncbi:MAG: uracil-DNA glycosylase [Melioribacteraceae bacterium]|nr:uracil-DNA glycosylase [Melioribacteraceae bacterium]MCF8264525.1 uracil-DNA glycosylase [Melioribacteraceae bacterium]MCF8431351.1 uracil-DNA glycosylase [Melioribacteraceae bacterium]